jgi:hypothetical protein
MNIQTNEDLFSEGGEQVIQMGSNTNYTKYDDHKDNIFKVADIIHESKAPSTNSATRV